MLTVSNAFREYVAGGGHLLNRLVFTFADETTQTVTGDGIKMGGLTVNNATSKSREFTIGAAVVGTSQITLTNYDREWEDTDFTDATVTVEVGATVNNSTEWLQLGVYGVEQPESYDSTITLSCSDNMRLLKRSYTDVATGYPATLQVIVADICDACDMTLLTTTFPTSSLLANVRPEDTKATCLDVISWAAQMAGCFASVDPLGRLRIGWYDKDAFEEESTADVRAIEYVKALTVTTDDVVITGLRVIAADEINDDGTTGDTGESYLYGNEGYVLEISSNPLIAFGSAQTVATTIGPQIVGMEFRPLTLTALGDPTTETGDAIQVTDRHGNVFNSYVTNNKWVAGGLESIGCDAETPARRKSEQFSAMTRAFIEQNRRLKVEQSARETAAQLLAMQIAGVSGFYQTEEEQQDGSVIRYYHNKPTLAESDLVWMFTADVMAMSTDGGESYPYAIDVTGNAILNRIYAIGLDARYITAGRVGREGGGSYIDFETGDIVLGSNIAYGDGTLADALDDARRYATDYLSYQDGELTLGVQGAEIRNVMTNQMQVYRTDEGDVAWYGKTEAEIWEMFIETARIQNKLSFNDFAWIARQNGNMTLKWMGA